MATIAVYNLKGGVGKTTLAVNLAWISAGLSARRTLLWDLDPQGAASFILGDGTASRRTARGIFSREVAIEDAVRPTADPRLDLIPADPSLIGVDRLFADLGKKKRLANLIAGVTGRYDRVFLDCPPGLSELSAQIVRAADVILVPVIPSPLSERAFAQVMEFIDRTPGRRAAVLPVHSMVDRRRTTHRDGLAANADWPIIPMTANLEATGSERRAIGTFASRSPGAAAIALLWQGIERRLVSGAA